MKLYENNKNRKNRKKERKEETKKKKWIISKIKSEIITKLADYNKIV